jgi:hypothetical protein
VLDLILHFSSVVPSKRPHSPDLPYPINRPRQAINPSDMWLQELHSKVWNRENRRAELFRETTLTIADYIKLQKILKAKHPKREDDTYEARVVQPIKANFLRTLEPSGPAHPQPGSDVEDDELRSLFPATIKYLDISCLQLSETPRIPVPLLIRRDYQVMSDLLEKAASHPVIVSGQPGTGEAFVLHSFFESNPV